MLLGNRVYQKGDLPDEAANVEAREDASSRPLDSIDVSVPELYPLPWPVEEFQRARALMGEDFSSPIH